MGQCVDLDNPKAVDSADAAVCCRWRAARAAALFSGVTAFAFSMTERSSTKSLVRPA